jgi:hypothetical protein
LFDEIKAISIPEKKAEKDRDIAAIEIKKSVDIF